MDEAKKRLLKTIANRLTKGGVKSIPIAGGILEEAIFGVLDTESARKESAKLEFALQKLQDSIDEQTQSLDALLRAARDQANLSEDARVVVDRLLPRLSDADAGEETAAILEAAVTRQNIDLSSVSDDADALQREIEQRLRPEIVTRAALVTKVAALTHGDIDILVATLGAYGIPEKTANRKSRAAKLVEWTQRPDGNGLAEIVFAARALDLAGFQRAIPDPQ